MPRRDNPLIALVLSAVPGLGHLYTRDRAKGVALLFISVGVYAGILLATIGPPLLRSWLTSVVLGIVYLFVWIPATIDAYQQARGIPKTLLSGERAWYVILMLLTVGPMALPLLWQSARFSRLAKLAWTAAIILVILGGILLLLVVGPAMEALLEQFRKSLQTGP